MKLKKIVLAMLVIALVFVAAGCPMTAKEYKKAAKEFAAEEQNGIYQTRLNDWKDWAIEEIAYKLTIENADYAFIKDTVKEVNKNSRTTYAQEYYGVKGKYFVYKGEKNKPLLKVNYAGKTAKQIAEAIRPLFVFQDAEK